MEERTADTSHLSPHRHALIVGAFILSTLLVLWAFLGLRGIQASDVLTSVVISICNDGIVSPGEVCDAGAGNNIGTYGSSTSERICAPGCLAWGPYCGDGVLQVRFAEQCDDGNNTSGDLCDATCRSEPPATPPGSPSRGSTPDVPGALPGTILSEQQTRVVLRGKAFPNSVVSILLDGKQFGTAQADANADFLFSSAAITPGIATFGFLAKDTDGIESITTSVVFEVVQSAVTTVANVFIPPTIRLSDNRVPPGAPLTVSGHTVPNATVTTQIEGSDGPLTALADQAGSWAIQIDSASLSDGFHAVKASFKLSELIKSGFGKSINFYIGDGSPKGGVSPDLNHDGKVNLVDFSIFLLSWNTDDVRSDFNEDGKVNLADFSIMLFAWTG